MKKPETTIAAALKYDGEKDIALKLLLKGGAL